MNARHAFFAYLPFALAVSACSYQAEAAGKERWIPVGRADLSGTPDLALRNRDTLNLRAEGDFNGDGRKDVATINKDAGSSKYGVVACLSQSSGSCSKVLVTKGPLAHLSTLGIQAVPVADVRRALANKGQALGAKTSDKGDALEVFAFEASSTIYSWTGARFEPTQISD